MICLQYESGHCCCLPLFDFGLMSRLYTYYYILIFTVFDWIVVDRAGDGFPFANSSSNGLVVTSAVTMVYITAPPLFLSKQFRSYGQRLHVKVSA